MSLGARPKMADRRVPGVRTGDPLLSALWRRQVVPCCVKKAQMSCKILRAAILQVQSRSYQWYRDTTTTTFPYSQGQSSHEYGPRNARTTSV